MKTKCVDNTVNIYETSSKSKVKVYNDQKQFQYCLVTSIVHTPSPESVSTSSDVTQNKVVSEKI